jgi:hypothetical protein
MKKARIRLDTGWTETRRIVEEAIQGNHVDHLILPGSHASSHDLLEILHGLVNNEYRLPHGRTILSAL